VVPAPSQYLDTTTTVTLQTRYISDITSNQTVSLKLKQINS
jgi:hypothetical protein